MGKDTGSAGRGGGGIPSNRELGLSRNAIVVTPSGGGFVSRSGRTYSRSEIESLVRRGRQVASVERVASAPAGTSVGRIRTGRGLVR
jgi:hypothetical protein